jgi:hypothetical protein
MSVQPSLPRLPMKSILLFLTAATTALVARGQEIPNPGFEQPQIQPSPGFITPGSAEHAVAVPMLEWAFGHSSGVCLEGQHHAAGLSAAEGRQVAFIQGYQADQDGASGPWYIFGADVTGLQPGEEYEISWQQTGRANDTGSGAVLLSMTVPGEVEQPPLVVFHKEPVGTQGEWETKSTWFTATAPTMRLNVHHFLHEALNAPEDPETTLFDDFKIRAGRAAD